MNARTTNGPDLDEDRVLNPDHPTPPNQPAPAVRPTSPAPSPGSSSTGTPKMELSLTQVLGGSLAAATAAGLGSRLGVVGTITGAALVSVVASVAGAVYTTSLRRTKHQVSRALGTVGSVRAHPARLRPRVRIVAGGAAAVFALTAAGVTGVELLTGTSLNGRPGRTTVSTSLQGDPGPAREAEAPARTAPASPSVSSTSSGSPSSSATPSGAVASQSPTSAPSEATSSPTASSSPSESVSTQSTPSPTPTSEPTGSVVVPTAEPTSPAQGAPNLP